MAWKDPTGRDPYEYLEGFNNHFSISHPSAPNALPTLGHNPQHGPYGLYTEQLSGTAFTAPRHLNQRTWLYRIRPSVCHTPFSPHRSPPPHFLSSFTNLTDTRLCPTPTQLRWDPFPSSATSTWLSSLSTIAGAGEAQTKHGLAIHVYGFGTDMLHEAFYNSDGDLLLLPVQGTLDIQTEFGKLWVPPGEVCIIPRGMKFSVHRGDLKSNSSGQWTGYILESFSALHFTLPDLGPIGANGLANPRDFKYPVPWYEDVDYPLTAPDGATTVPHFTLHNKFLGSLYTATQPHSPFDVLSFNGNYLPYKYLLTAFSPVGSISHDHPDPSIFTVLSLPNPATPGTSLADLVLFPPRWLVARHTFRPPYFHRNVMSEFMINVYGEYDAKDAGKGGFVPGGASLHGMNVAHGPDKKSWEKETSRKNDEPVFVGQGSMAVMFETSLQLVTTKWAVEGCGVRQVGYNEVWEGFEPLWRMMKPEGA
ncbi:Homogentisate 1,2-dioxygenase [Kalaharituber pfeilii]|nr:Homogentisate 1,2-dioxygenase [Kalaharituber pfeilii]